MQLETARGAAAVDTAAAAVASPDEARNAVRDVLIGAFGRGAIDRSDVLGIAEPAHDNARVDGDLRAGAFLPALLASAAKRECNLELGAAGGLGGRCAVADGIAQSGDDGVM